VLGGEFRVLVNVDEVEADRDAGVGGAISNPSASRSISSAVVPVASASTSLNSFSVRAFSAGDS